MTDLSYAAPGFGPLTIGDVLVNGTPIHNDFQDAIIGATVTRGLNLASTFTVQLTDPKRKLLNSPNFIQYGDTIEIPDGFGNYLQFTLWQVAKASDQLQLMFESAQVYRLQGLRGIMGASNVTDAGAYVKSICDQAGIPFIGPINDPYAQPAVYSVGSSSTYNTDEDAWTTMNRIAGTLGWRCWESAGVVFFGPDEFWFNHILPPVNLHFFHSIPTLNEFTQEVQIMDFDWNIGSPFGDLTITTMTNFWQYNPGELIKVENLGPASGIWMVSSMQRNFFTPQATVTATIPIPASQVLNPPTLPIISGRPQI